MGPALSLSVFVGVMALPCSSMHRRWRAWSEARLPKLTQGHSGNTAVHALEGVEYYARAIYPVNG